MVAKRGQTSRGPGNTSSVVDPPTSSNAEVIERKVQLLIAEYNFVSGLITFYRSVELRALGGTGLMLTAIAAAVAAFEAADEPNREAESLLLSIAAWIPVVLVLIAIVALYRGLRAVVYVKEHLHPLSETLTSDRDLLAWELLSGVLLERYVEDRSSRSDHRLRFVKVFLDGAPIVISIAATSVLLAIAGFLVRVSALTLLLGGSAGVFAVTFATYGYAVGRTTRRSPIQRSDP
jgi:hypothetical protein